MTKFVIEKRRAMIAILPALQGDWNLLKGCVSQGWSEDRLFEGSRVVRALRWI